MQRIVPNIWSTRNAEEMGAFYADALPDAESEVESRYPEEGLLDFQQEFAGQPLTVTVMVAGTRLTLINAGDEFRPTPAISFMLNFDPARFGGSSPDAVASATITLDRTWDALVEGGIVRMELGEYPFAARYGWVEDRYGVNWQLMLTDPAGEPRPFVVPALMFGGPAQDKAAQAADFYVSLFSSLPGGAAVGNRFPYGVPTGPASAEALAYGEFRVGDLRVPAGVHVRSVDVATELAVLAFRAQAERPAAPAPDPQLADRLAAVDATLLPSNDSGEDIGGAGVSNGVDEADGHGSTGERQGTR